MEGGGLVFLGIKIIPEFLGSNLFQTFSVFSNFFFSHLDNVGWEIEANGSHTDDGVETGHQEKTRLAPVIKVALIFVTN